MSSYIMHMCISDIVKRKLDLTDKFIYGSVLPDVIKSITGYRDITHYIKHVIVDGDRRSLPDIQKAIKDLKIKDNEIRMGYVAHLVEDLIWFNDFIPMYAIDLGDNKIQYLKDSSMHTDDEYRDDIYSDYTNSSNYVVNKCGVDIQNILSNVAIISNNDTHKKLILENTNYPKETDISQNTFMTKESIDRYIEVCTKEVEKIVLELIGE